MNLSIKIFISLVLAVIVGLIAGEPALPFINWWIAPIGTIFINLIKMMIVPVVLCSLVVGMTSLGDTTKLGRIGIKTILLYLVTTAIAIVIGFGVAGLAHPGVGLQMTSDAVVKVKEAPASVQVGVAMSPANPVASMAKADILPVIVFALFIGVGILKVGGERADILIKFFDACAEGSYKIIVIVMSFAPIGVFALLLPVVAKNGPSVLLPLISVIACVAVGCIIHAVAVYSTLAKVWGGHTPAQFFRGMSEAMLIAFTTCSSAAALPVNMKNSQEKLGVSRDVSSFVLPLGATINMSGAAITIAVLSLAAAHTLGISVDLPTALLLCLVSTVGACGASGVAGGSQLLLPVGCASVGIGNDIAMQVVGVGFIIGVIQDACETALNSSTDVLFTATAEFAQRAKEGKLRDEDMVPHSN